MNAFYVALNAVLPFLIYLALGYAIREHGDADEAYFRKLNGIIFHYFFPCVTFANIYNVSRDVHFDPAVAAAAAAGVVVTVIVLMILVPRFVPGNPQRGAIVQAIYRSNFVLYALPIATSVCGEAGTTVAAMMVALIVPLFNFLAVFVLSWYSGTRPNPVKIIRDIATNPLIDGAVLGAILRAADIVLPQAVHAAVNSISAMSTPLALIVLGGTLRFDSVRKDLHYILPACLIKLLVLPLIATILLLPTGFDPVERFVIMVVFAAPVATASFTMAQNMGSDGPLAGELVVMSTAMSLFTLFFWIFLYGILGLL